MVFAAGAVLFAAVGSDTRAYTAGAWNTGYTLGVVRQNGTGFWFTVVPKQTNDTGKWFGCWNTLPNYNTLVLIIMTAKATGKTVDFYVDNASLPNTGGLIASVTAVDIN
jgi:hypothetical protein